MNTQIVTPTRSQSNAYREYRERLAHEASYETQAKLAETRQKRQERAYRMTAEFLGYEGDIIFAA